MFPSCRWLKDADNLFICHFVLEPSLFPTKLEGSPGTFDGWLKITSKVRKR